MVARLAAHAITALELAELHIAQIERLNPELNALVDFDADRVRTQARKLDAMPASERGLLHGLPVTIKASISVAGHRCETGSMANRGFMPEADAEVVRRMRAAGAVILGTTNCPEFLMAYETDNLLYGKTNNPWDLGRSAGGSSGGESAAIAACLSAGGLGSDGGGSVRTPAHFTGICALKPTPGRIPTQGHLPANRGPFALLGVIGPMARTIADVSLLFRVVSGALDIDPAGAPVPYRAPDLDALKQTTIGYFEEDEDAPATVETKQAVRDAVAALRSRGFKVEPFRPHSLEKLRELWWVFFVRCGAMLLEPATLGSETSTSPTFKDFLTIAHRGAAPSGEELLHAWMAIDPVREAMLKEMAPYPFLLSPVCSVPAFRHGEREWLVGGKHVEYLDAMRYTQWFNMLASPSAVVPVGRSPEGLPIGVQVAGRPYADEEVLAIAAVIDEAFGYKAPPMAAASDR